MTWETFGAAGGGIVAVQLPHIVAIYDAHGTIKLSTTARDVHVLRGVTVRRATALVSAPADSHAASSGSEAVLQSAAKHD